MSNVDEEIRNGLSQTALGADAKERLTKGIGSIVTKLMQEKRTVAVARASLQEAMKTWYDLQFINETERDVGLGIVDDLLKACGFQMEEESQKKARVYHSSDVPTAAFEIEYQNHGGEEAFWHHVQTQRSAYNERRETRLPFFSIFQSSGYGKSRLVVQLMKKQYESKKPPAEGVPRIVYLSFAHETAFPRCNVGFDLVMRKGEAAEMTDFCNLFYNAIHLSRTVAKPKFFLGAAVNDEAKDANEDSEDILLIVDEVSQLMKLKSIEGVGLYQCFCRATKEFETTRGNCFFVVLSTFSSAGGTIPSRAMDSSRKTWTTACDGNLEPMESFLLHQALGLRKEGSMSIDECLEPMHMLSLGRPMWGAYLEAGMKAGMSNEVLYTKMLQFAVEKLLLASEYHPIKDLSREQMLALLGCRVCLTISPESRYASFLIGSHMATAVHISSDREAIVAEYPSEPILALASRSYTQGGSVSHLLTMLNKYFADCAVSKGHRGEVIVRLLNLFAMDKCMREAGAKRYAVCEVSLTTFLEKFSRKLAPLPDVFPASEDAEMGNSPAPKERMLNEIDSESVIHQVPQPCFPLDAKVCFTHFVRVARTNATATITPELLRRAYKRSAALAVEDGRRGIDWIIPLRLKDDKFIGLVGQDKNRKSDVLESLAATEETGQKLSAVYFLTEAERQMFEEQGSGLYWPTVCFAVGAPVVGSARLPKDSPITQSGNTSESSKFPTLVLSGLGYDEIVGEDAEDALKKLRDSYVEPPEVYQHCVPVTFGAAPAWEFSEGSMKVAEEE